MRDAGIALEADLAEIVRMNDWLAGQFADDDALFQRIKLCLNEAVENTIRYGFAPEKARAGEIAIALSESEGCVTLELRDNGCPFNPLDAPPPEKLTDLETAKIGGFGIALMRDAATGLAYRHTGSHNVLNARFCPD